MLNLSFILIYKWFRWCTYRYIVVILEIPYTWRVCGYGSYWLTYVSALIISALLPRTHSEG